MIQSLHYSAIPSVLHPCDKGSYSSHVCKNRWRLFYKDLRLAGSLDFRKQGTRTSSPDIHTAIRYPRAALVVDQGSTVEHSSDGRLKVGNSDENVQSLHIPGIAGHGHDMSNVLELLSEFLNDEGLPRWVCPTPKSKQMVSNAPILLFLPGIVGTSIGLLFHQEALGKLFRLRLLHIPLMDRTPFEGLVSIVEEAVQKEARSSPGSPVYLVGDEFGGALALAVAAQNSHLDLVLVLLNPATSINTSALQQFLPILHALPSQMFSAAPVLFGLLMSNPNPFWSSKLTNTLASLGRLQNLSEIVGSVISSIPKIVHSLCKDTVLWKLSLLQSSALLANSRIHGVQSEVLILASNKDQLLPSLQEAKRLSKLLPNCTYRQFTESSHSLLLEENFDLASVIKSTGHYHQKSKKDIVEDFVFPTEDEITKFYESTMPLRRFCSPAFFSTADNGEVVQGLSMIPSKGPLIFVGNHALLGLDMKIVASEMLKSRKEAFRGLGHPMLFMDEYLEEYPGIVEGDLGRLFGAVPVSAKNMFKLLSRGDSVALYPGGAREALHRKGEEYKLFWPEQAEFVKMAAKFGATIIPLSTVGEDEIIEILADFDDLARIPVLGDKIMEHFEQLPRLRANLPGEISKQILHMPLVGPKLHGPGRLYILFGQPIYTKGKMEYFRDQKNVWNTYQQVKGEVEAGISYLLQKRQTDPYKNFLPRILYELLSVQKTQAPSFKT